MSNRYIHIENRAILAIAGEDARSFLQGLITQDINTVSPSQSAYGTLLNAQGKFLHDFFIAQHGDAIWLDCDATRRDDLLRLLRIYCLRAKVTITDLHSHYHVLAALGELSALTLPSTPGRTESFEEHQILAMVDPRMTEMGARVIALVDKGENWLEQRGFSHIEAGDYRRNRLKLGVPDGSIDLVPGKSLLLENGIDQLHGVSFEKGCYVGQEVTARTKHRAELRKQLYCVKAAGRLPPIDTPIMLGERTVGEMRSSHEDIGLAMLRHDAVSTDEPLTAAGIALEAHLPAWNNN